MLGAGARIEIPGLVRSPAGQLLKREVPRPVVVLQSIRAAIFKFQELTPQSPAIERLSPSFLPDAVEM
jgi:hypothetical protein